MAKSFTEGFYAALRSNRDDEEEKVFSSSHGSGKRDNETTTTQGGTQNKERDNSARGFTERFYRALESTPEPQRKQFTPSLPDFRENADVNWNAVRDDRDDEEEARASGGFSGSQDKNFFETMYDKYIGDEKFLPSSWEDFGRGMGYSTERAAAGLLGMGEDITDFIGSGFYGAMKGITSAGGLAPNPVSEWAGNAAEKYLENSVSEDYEKSIKERYNPSAVEENQTGIVQEVAKMLAAGAASKLAGAFSGGAAALNGADEAARAANISKGVFGTYAAGAGENEAYDEGASLGQALTFGATTGAMETVIESIAGGIPGFGGGKLTQVVEKVFSSPIVSRIVDIAGEGAEEALSEIVTPFIKRAVYDSDAELATPEEIAEAAVLGMVTSGILQAGYNIPPAISSALDARRAARSAQETATPAAATEQEEAPAEIREALQEEAQEELQQDYPATQEEAAVNAAQEPPVTLEDAAREVAAQDGKRTQGETAGQTDAETVDIDSAEGRANFPNVNRVLDAQETAPEIQVNERYGDIGKRAFTDIVESTNLTAEEVETQFQTAYELGRLDTPMDRVPLANDIQQTAFNAGRMDHIADMGNQQPAQTAETAQKVVEPAAAQAYTGGEMDGLTALKNRLNGYNEAVINGVRYTVDQSGGKFNVRVERADGSGGYVTDARAKIFADGPFETREEAVQTLMDVAAYNKLTVNKEDTDHGNAEMEEVPDGGRVLEPDEAGQSDGGLLDGLASEDQRGNESGRDVVSAPESGGRETSGTAGGSDAQRPGRGRSVGSGERGDLLPDT